MFIRTKDGIYDFEEQRGNIENRGEKSFLAIGNDYRGCICYDYEEIIEQADSIEELCDGFVVDDKRNNVHYLMNYNDIIEEIYYGRIHEKDVVYGAIWTKKGLIYVAKMNENGKLELI